MGRDGGRAEVAAYLDVPRETLERLEAFVEFLREENLHQNLVSADSLQNVWRRHILDSAQLLRFKPPSAHDWIDLGTGAGFPGLIIALLHDGHTVLVEERRKRVDFLQRAAEILGIEEKVTIWGARIEKCEARPFDVISARAFAPLERLFELSHSFSTEKTRFILPKGRNASSELEVARNKWQADFSLEQSLTDADAKIIIADGVRRKTKRDRAKEEGAV